MSEEMNERYAEKRIKNFDEIIESLSALRGKGIAKRRLELI